MAEQERSSITVTKDVIEEIRQTEIDLSAKGISFLPYEIRGDKVRLNLSSIVTLGIRTLRVLASGDYELVKKGPTLIGESGTRVIRRTKE